VRILCHAQSLSGVGHLVRGRAIARGLRAAHDVYLVDGGRPIPVRPDIHEPIAVPVPPLFRAAGRLSGAEGPDAAPRVLEERARILAQAVERIRPDVVLIEHFPFSKWELGREMAAVIGAARRASARARVVCSLRDIVRKTRYEDEPLDRYEARVLSLLRDGFDAILVHSDPAFSRLEEHFRRAADLPVPVHYTGFVVEPPAAGRAPSGEPYAVLSCGGGARGQAFLLDAIEAFRRASARGIVGAMRLHVFPGAFAGPADVEALRAATRGGPFRLRTFSPDFATWLAASALSISRAGYNTCGQILAAGVRSVLVPDPEMSDQEPRAARLAALGVATVAGAPARAEDIAAAIETTLVRPPARAGLDLDGVAATRAIVERLAAEAPPARPAHASERRVGVESGR
jgi:predicted glycosyltransferase